MKNIEFYYNELLEASSMYLFCVDHGMDERESEKCTNNVIKWLNEEHQILDDVEKRYLKNVIRPFVEKVRFIVKIRSGDYEHITIYYEQHGLTYFIILPSFKEGTMYKGMKPNEEYELEEIGL